MAKLPTIRITKSDREEYRRLQRNTKAKIRRTKKTYGVDLSSEIDLPDIDSFQSRKEFNEWKERQRRFTNRNVSEYQFRKNQYGVVASKKELYDIEQSTKDAQRVARKKLDEVKETPTYHDGKRIGTVGDRTMYMKEPDVTGIHVPKDFDFDKVRNRRRLDDIKESMLDRSTERYYDEKDTRMLENFKIALKGHYGSQADELIKLIDELNPTDFIGIYHANFTVFDFNLLDSEGNMMSTGNENDEVRLMIDIINRFKESDYYNPE